MRSTSAPPVPRVRWGLVLAMALVGALGVARAFGWQF
jgi:hypothetical protein